MAPKCTRLLNFFNRYREFFMATLQPVICLVEKKENSPFFRIFLQCLLDYRHILKQFFVAVFNARECFQAINKIDNIGNLIFCWWNSAMSIILLSVYLLKKLLKQLKKKIFSRTMALENLERLLRELEMKTSTPRWVIKIPYCRFWVHDLEPVASFCGQRTEKVLAFFFYWSPRPSWIILRPCDDVLIWARMELSYPHAPWNCSNLEPWFVYLCSCFVIAAFIFDRFTAHFLN